MEHRPDPDALLRQVEQEQKQERSHGKLKIFFGYAAGVGKTYAMLEAAHAAKRNGMDVVIGYIEPHTRPETMALVDGLEQLPLREVRHKGVLLRDFDLDAALKRAPQLILVDELAHTNAEGSRHEKRFQDVKELLRSGIDVYTTVNVQHLESLNDLVASITGVLVRERVPDRIFDEAEQVELVDIEPADLLARLQAGKVYRSAQAHRALENFFTVENLTALREIALRRTADRVNRVAQRSSAKASAAIAEHILICLSAAPSNPKVIRTAARLCEAFHGRFTALYVMGSQTERMSSEDDRRLKENMRLAEQLGARIVTVYGDDVPVQIAEYAKVSGVTKIVLGRTNTRAVLFGRRKSFVERLNELTPDIDVYIIPGAGTEKKYRAGSAGHVKDVPLNPRSAGLALLIFVLSTALSVVSKSMGFNDAFVITLFVFGILLTAVTTGNRLLGLIMAVVSVLTYNYFFTEPYLTFRVSDPGYGMAFLLMLLVSIVSGSMARRVRRQARQEAEKAHRTEILLRASQKFQRITDERDLLEELGSELVALLGRSVTLYSAGKALGDPLFFPARDDPHDAAFYTTPDECAVAAWVFKNRKHAGATTGTLPGAKCLYLAARSQDAVQAVVGISLADGGTLGSFERNLLLTLLDVVSLAIERIRLTRTKNQVQREAEQAEFQANLLRMISHDLRTPLTSISGNAELLLREDGRLEKTKRRQLYDDIEHDSQWLEELVENLLAMTRVENDAAALKLQPEMVGDVIEEAVSHTQSRLKGRSLKIEQEDEYLMAHMDAHLIVQVIVNLIDNAVKYTPAGTGICLRSYSEGRQACIEVSDQGPGVPDAEKEKLFGMFYTANNVHGDGRRGIGLGLALCRTIVNAHGGSISVRDNVPHGCVFCLRLQKENNPDMQIGGTAS